MIRGDIMPHYEDLRIARGDVLIAERGRWVRQLYSVARSSQMPGQACGASFAAGDLMAIRFAEPDLDLSLYVYAFLLTAPGLARFVRVLTARRSHECAPTLWRIHRYPDPERVFRVATLNPTLR